jgi:hypothetical protein
MVSSGGAPARRSRWRACPAPAWPGQGPRYRDAWKHRAGAIPDPSTTALRDEEALDSRRIPDDRQAIAVTDQLNLVIHRPLLKRGQRAPSPRAPRWMGVGLSSPLCSSPPGPVSAQAAAAGQVSSLKMAVQLLILPAGFGRFFPHWQMVRKRTFIAASTSGNDPRRRTAARNLAYIDGDDFRGAAADAAGRGRSGSAANERTPMDEPGRTTRAAPGGGET